MELGWGVGNFPLGARDTIVICLPSLHVDVAKGAGVLGSGLGGVNLSASVLNFSGGHDFCRHSSGVRIQCAMFLAILGTCVHCSWVSLPCG
jgi:hypothetical protein